MSEMVERVARAIGDTPNRYGGTLRALLTTLKRIPELRDSPLSDAEVLEWLARAAIEAMREPTRAMYRTFDKDGGDVMEHRGAAIDYWTAMIDAALAPAPTAAALRAGVV